MTVLVYVAGALALLSGIGVVAARKTIYSALSLVANMVSLAVLFLLLNAQFLAAVQVIIYAGAVMVLFVFIIALLSPGAEDHPPRDYRLGLGLAAVALLTVQVFALANNGTTYAKDTPQHTLHGEQLAKQADPKDPAFQFTPDNVNKAGNVQTVGGQLFTTFLLPFEITSLLLLVAAIGAVYLTRRQPSARDAGGG
jgi:NADH-quinone oxidoreductase subunit J